MRDGRTLWWAADIAFLRRELVVELGEEFGAAGPLVLMQLNAEAKEQRDGGRVKSGFRHLARTCFLSGPEEARKVIEHAAGIGALDDYDPDDDGRRFTCRVSGFQADQQLAHAAARQQAKRDRDAAARGVTERDESVTERDAPLPTGQDRTVVEDSLRSSSVEPARLDDARKRLRREVVGRLFDYWRERCDHPQAKLTSDRRSKVEARLRNGYTEDQIRQGIDGAATAPYVSPEGKVYDDLELICRSGSKLEDFIARAATAPKPGALSPQDEGDAIVAATERKLADRGQGR